MTCPLASYQFDLYTTLPIDFRGTDATLTGFRVDVRRKNTYVPTEAWPRDPLHFAETIARVRRRHNSVWVIVTPTREPLIPTLAPQGASDRDRFRHRWEAFMFPFHIQALRQGFGIAGVPPQLRMITLQQYVDGVMRRAGYRRAGTPVVRPLASLTHWRR